MLRKTLLLVGIAGLVSCILTGATWAATFDVSESGDAGGTWGTAQDTGTSLSMGDILNISGGFTNSDVDFYQFVLNSAAWLDVYTGPGATNPLNNAQAGVYDTVSSGHLVGYDINESKSPADGHARIFPLQLAAGTYRIGMSASPKGPDTSVGGIHSALTYGISVTGANDGSVSFDTDDHNQAKNYVLTVEAVPEASSVALFLMGLAGVGWVRFRRRRE
jgi:hypothetical protein